MDEDTQTMTCSFDDGQEHLPPTRQAAITPRFHGTSASWDELEETEIDRQNPESFNFQIASIIEAERDLQDLLDSIELLRAKAKDVHSKISELSIDICQKLDKEDAKCGLRYAMNQEGSDFDELSTSEEMSTAILGSSSSFYVPPDSFTSADLLNNDELREVLIRNNELLARIVDKKTFKSELKAAAIASKKAKKDLKEPKESKEHHKGMFKIKTIRQLFRNLRKDHHNRNYRDGSAPLDLHVSHSANMIPEENCV